MYPAYSQTILVNKPISSYANYLQQARESPYWKDVEFDGFNLPAQSLSKPYCSKWISYGCDNTKQHPRNQHYCEHQKKTCKVSSCPLCHESWIGRSANRSTKRLAKFLEIRKHRVWKFRHVILSPPPDQAVNLSYASLKTWLDTALKVANIKTAMVVFHHARFQDKKKSRPYVSPHFHLLVYGHITNTKEFYNKTKWTIKNKGDLKTDKDIFTCVRYLLSHAGVRKGTSTVRYLGDISYRKLKVEKEPRIPNCPYCFLPLKIFSINFDVKHKPPPIDHVGLWNPNCFSPIDDNGNDTKIPFYKLDSNNETYSEELIYSFEELMHIKLNSHKIAEHKYLINQLDRITALSCHTITSFC